MKNNLLEINFLQNMIERCNQRILEIREEIQNEKPQHNLKLRNIVLKQQIIQFIKKREKAKKKFDNLVK